MLLIQLCGRLCKGSCALLCKGKCHIILRCRGADRPILGRSAFYHGAIQNQGAVCGVPFPEGEICRGADLLDCSFRIKIRLAGLPRELQDQPVSIHILIKLIVGQVHCNQAVLNDQLCCVQLFLGGIKSIRRNKHYIDTALDIHAKADVLRALQIGTGHIPIAGRDTKKRCVGKYQDQQQSEDQLQRPCFFLHIRSRTSKLLLTVRPKGRTATILPVYSASSFSTVASRTQTHSRSEAVSTSSRLG